MIKYTKEIEEIVQKFFANNANIEDLVKEKNIEQELYKLTKKLSTKFCYANDIDTRDGETIFKLFGKIVEQNTKKLYLDSDFDFNLSLSLEKFNTALANIANIRDQEIQPLEISVTPDIARTFLPMYQKKLADLEKDQLAKGKIKNKNKKIEAIIAKTAQEILSIKNTINLIESNKENFIKISVPLVKTKFKDFTKEQLDILIKAADKQVDAPYTKAFTKLRRHFKILSSTFNKTNENIATIIKKIPIEHLNINHISTLFDKKDYQLATEITGKLLNKLIKEVDLNAIKFPLTPNQEKSLAAIIKIHELLSKHSTNQLVKGLLENNNKLINSNHISKILEQHEKFLNIDLLNADTSIESSISKHLKQSEAKFIKLFAKLTNFDPIKDTEKEYLTSMLEKVMGNNSFNKKLTSLLREKNNFSAKKYSMEVGDLRYFSYKTRHYDKVAEINKKCQRNLALIALGQNVEEVEKLTQLEYGILVDMHKIKSKLDKYNEQGVIPQNGKLADLYKQSKEAFQLINQIQERTVNSEKYKAGDIFMVHTKRSKASKQEKITLKSSLKSGDLEFYLTEKLISKYGHAAQIYIDPETKMPSISHIYGAYQTDPVSTQDIATCDIFRINPAKLISPENAKLFENLYQDKNHWKVEIKKTYQQILQEIHEKQQDRFGEIENDKKARFRAGLADFKYKGHKADSPQDFAIEHQAIYGINDMPVKSKMICSEFVVKNTVAAFVELNKRLAKQLEEHNITHNKAMDLVKIPIAKNEILEKIHPQRLISILSAAECLEKIEPENVINQLVSYKSLDGHQVSKDIASDLYNKMKSLANTAKDVDYFVSNAHKIFKAYLDAEKIGGDFTKKEILHHLDKSFAGLYHEYDKRQPQTFGGKLVKLMNNLLEFIGLKDNKAYSKIKETVKHIKQHAAKNNELQNVIDKPHNQWAGNPKSQHIQTNNI
jgi:hypothetical protein